MRKIQSLNGIWQWHSDSPSHDAVYTGEVPGTVISHMLQNKLIEDPYWRCNEYAVRELMANNYLYERTFTVSGEDLDFSCAELICDGIDTIASISINSRLVAETRDMHRTYRLPVKEFLQEGENRIEVFFHSPLDFVRKEDEGNDIFYASTGCIHGNAALRKAHYMFGWDWGPQLPDMGIFRNIAIEYFSEAKIQDIQIRQEHGSSGSAGLKFEVEIKQLSSYENRQEQRQTWFTETEITDPEGGLVSRTVRNSREWQYEETIPEPRLWWPNGLGEHPLYRVSIRLLD